MDGKYTMKKLLLTLMLSIVSTSAMAEWVEVAEGGEEIETITAYAVTLPLATTSSIIKMILCIANPLS